MSFNFAEAESAKESNFLKPGVYTFKITEIKLDKFPKGATYLGFTFTSEDGQTLLEKFGYNWKDQSAKQNEIFMSRLQYLHEAWVGKKCEKAFKNPEEIEAYFKKLFTSKAPAKRVVVGGEVKDGKTYAALPFTAFVLDSDSELEDGEFTEGDANWKKYVKKSTQTSEVAGKKGGILNDPDEDVVSESKGKESKEDANPW